MAFILYLFLAGLSFAQAADWVVTRVSGTVYLVAPGVEAKHVHKGMRLPRGYTIATRKGRAVLQHGRDAITLAPNTEFALSEHGSFSDRTKLLQRKGEITVDVFPRSGPFFTVETPYLAAVVKGTSFKVSVKKGQAQVNVSEGVVGVKDFASGQAGDLKAGQAARSAPGAFRGLRSVGKTRATFRQESPSAPSFGAVNPNAATPAPKSGLGGLFGLFGGSGSSTGANGTSAGGQGVSAGASAGAGGVSAGASAGGASAGASAGGGGVSAGASVGGASAGASVGGGGASVGASVGGASVGASIGGGGVNVNAGGLLGQ